jgi:hypothetical protein
VRAVLLWEDVRLLSEDRVSAGSSQHLQEGCRNELVGLLLILLGFGTVDDLLARPPDQYRHGDDRGRNRGEKYGDAELHRTSEVGEAGSYGAPRAGPTVVRSVKQYARGESSGENTERPDPASSPPPRSVGLGQLRAGLPSCSWCAGPMADHLVSAPGQSSDNARERDL